MSRRRRPFSNPFLQRTTHVAPQQAPLMIRIMDQQAQMFENTLQSLSWVISSIAPTVRKKEGKGFIFFCRGLAFLPFALTQSGIYKICVNAKGKKAKPQKNFWILHFQNFFDFTIFFQSFQVFQTFNVYFEIFRFFKFFSDLTNFFTLVKILYIYRVCGVGV